MYRSKQFEQNNKYSAQTDFDFINFVFGLQNGVDHKISKKIVLFHIFLRGGDTYSSGQCQQKEASRCSVGSVY